MSWHAGGIVLGGAATVETHRGLGAQTALLHARLADVARSDPATTGTMTLATATAAPDSPSLRNLKRAHVIVRLRHAWRAGAST